MIRRAVDRLLRAKRQILASRAEAGPYRFLVRRWDDVSDFELVSRVLMTDPFRNELVPLPLHVGEHSFFVLSPHPDDEAIGAGGTLHLAADAGRPLHLAYVTSGDLAEARPYAASPEGVAAVRMGEAETVCQTLGATMHRLGISNTEPRPSVEDLDRLAELLHDLRPSVILAPWLLDSPAKHRMVNHLLWLAHRRRGLPDCEVWGYQVHNVLLPNAYVDVTAVAERKRALLEVYVSQNRHHIRYDHLAMGMTAWNARFLPHAGDGVARYVETFFTLPLAELLGLVERFYFADLRRTYRGHANVLAGMEQLHREMTR